MLFMFLCIDKCFSTTGSIWQRGKKWISNPFDYIKSTELAVIENPYVSTTAYVRTGNDLHSQEKVYVSNRQLYVQRAIEKVVHQSLDHKYVPKISLICSGGGYRAMLGSVGALSGLEKIGLLDAVTYISSLSGSTWALGLWLSTGMNLKQLKGYISKQLMADFYKLPKSEKTKIAHMFLVKIAFQQPFSTVDLFGGFLARHLLGNFFGDKCQMIRMSDQMNIIQDGKFPFPIYSAVDGRINIKGQIPWYEFTPLEVGSAMYGLYVPTWAYGRKFNQGKSVDFAPEQSLGFHFGVFGSAYGAHFKVTWERVIQELVSSQAKALIERTLLKSRIANLRFSWARIRNFMIGMDVKDVMKKNKIIKMVDAGIEANLPYVPVSGERPERKQDILIFFDFSKNIPSALQKAEEYARNNNLKFPLIDYTDIKKKTISIFCDDRDADVPVIIYMTLISDKQLLEDKKRQPLYRKYRMLQTFDFDHCVNFGACRTTNFQYSLRESKLVMNQMEFNIIANQEKIVQVIKDIIEQKSIINEIAHCAIR